jgi:peptidoglycan hydrolase-like protein with peptidoglycan-binding domain
MLNEVTLNSGGYDINNLSSAYGVSVTNSTFSSWNGYALSSAGETLVQGSLFSQKAGSSKDVSLAKSVPRAIFLANTYPAGQVALSYDSTADPNNVAIYEGLLTDPVLAALGINGFSYTGLSLNTIESMIPSQPKPAKTDVNSLYDVTAYGAVADCTSAKYKRSNCTDNTKAFQAALSAAGKNGGGTVYIPGSPTASAGAGYYLTGNLQVPTGVELTGAAQDSSFHSIDTQTALFIEGNASPFITLASSAGVRGISFWYANQNGYPPPYGNGPMNFGYTIQAQGTNDWVENVVLVNSTKGLDFGTYQTTGHFIENVTATTIANALYVSKSTSGYVGDLQTGGTTWLDIDKNEGNQSIIDYPLSTGNPPLQDVNGDGWTDTDVGQPADLYTGVAILIGNTTNELVRNIYTHGSHYGLQTVSDGGAPSFTLINYGSESHTGLDFEALASGGVKVIASQYHTIGNDCYPQNCGDIPGDPYLIIGSQVSPTTPITLFAFANHSPTAVGFDLSGGRTIVQDYFSDQSSSCATDVETAVRVRGALTGFAMLGTKFINALTAGSTSKDCKGKNANPNATIISDDSSPNVALTSGILVDPVAVTGPVDLTFQPLWGQQGAQFHGGPATSTPSKVTGTGNGGGTGSGGSGSGGCSPTLTSNLSSGASGPSVVALQNALISLGYAIPAGATGYYGAQTVAAVQSFQRSEGIVSSGAPETTGYGALGPKTRAALGERCGTPSVTNGTTGGGTSGGTATSTPVKTNVTSTSTPSQGTATTTIIKTNVGTPKDQTPPSAPVLSLGSVSASGVSLTWTASIDNIGVAGYAVYRNDVLLTNVSGTSYTDTGVTSATPYSYYVVAKDSAGNPSSHSNTLNVQTPASSNAGGGSGTGGGVSGSSGGSGVSGAPGTGF